MNHKAKDKEQSVNQKLKHENQKLKRQLERLRKQLSRIDLDHFTNIKEALEAQQREDIVFEKESQQREKQVDLKKRWLCRKCSEDYLRLVVIQRPDGDFYFRKCPECKNKTRLKPFTENVQGQDVI